MPRGAGGYTSDSSRAAAHASSAASSASQAGAPFRARDGATITRTARSPQSISYRTAPTPGTAAHDDTMRLRCDPGTLDARTTNTRSELGDDPIHDAWLEVGDAERSAASTRWPSWSVLVPAMSTVRRSAATRDRRG